MTCGIVPGQAYLRHPNMRPQKLLFHAALVVWYQIMVLRYVYYYYSDSAGVAAKRLFIVSLPASYGIAFLAFTIIIYQVWWWLG
jgi:hypothetical protein